MRKAIFILLIALSFVLETMFPAQGIRPDLTVLPVYYVGLRFGAMRGVAFGALVGMITDSLTGGMLGPSMLGKGAVGLMAGVVSTGFLNWTPVLGVIWMFAMTALDGLLSFGSVLLFQAAPASAWAASLRILLPAGINAIAGFFIRPSREG